MNRSVTERRLARALTGLVATGPAVAGLGGAAAADPMNPPTPEDGLWYFDALGLPDIHASGITGEGVTIAILDGPINLEVPTLQGANIVVKDSFCRDASGAPKPGTSTDWDLASHGTEVVSLVVGSGAGYTGGIGVKGVAPGATVLVYPNYIEENLAVGESCHDESGRSRGDADALAIEDAVASGAQIISMSWGGSFSARTAEAITTALQHGVILVGALDNRVDSTTSVDGFPGASNGVVSVLSGASDGTLQSTLTDPASANTSDYVDVVAPGVNILGQGGPTTKDWTRQAFTDGTSYATWDAIYGYGTVSASTLLPVDPSQYEDVNPFIDPSITDDDFAGPSAAEIAGTSTSTPRRGSPPRIPAPPILELPSTAPQASRSSFSSAGLCFWSSSSSSSSSSSRPANPKREQARRRRDETPGCLG